MPLTARQRSLHSKNGAKRTTSFNKGKRKASDGEFIVTNAPSDLRTIAYPGGAVALGLLLVARISSAFYGQIADCDETFNYWEPLHYLVYGTGLQTWEYSPAYALRSYLPLWLLALPAKALSWVLTPVGVFYALRVLLAALGACAEFAFYKAVCHEFGVHVGRLWLLLALPAAGPWAAGAALLPAAWSGALVSGALACWWRRRMAAAVLLTAASALLSWPFTALLGLPIAIDMVIIKRQVGAFVKWSAASLLALLLPAVALDSWHYGRLAVAPWNIVVYNIFSEHGPELYGVEPWTYYFVNGFLNFNVVWVLALACPLLLAACAALAPRSTQRAAFCAPYWLDLLPLALWLGVFVLQPHKEERFLYPVYSLVLLAGAVALDCAQKLAFAGAERLGRRRAGARHYLAHSAPLAVACVLLAGAGGVSRIVALRLHYGAPMALLRALPAAPPAPPGAAPRLVCWGKEWHRSPSSFHLPPGYVTRFVASDFAGQLPAPYAPPPAATRAAPPHFNARNAGDNRTYVAAAACHFLVDSDAGAPTPRQPAYHRAPGWRQLARLPLLQPARSHRVLRAFYVPGLSPRHTAFAGLMLLQNTLLA